MKLGSLARVIGAGAVTVTLIAGIGCGTKGNDAASESASASTAEGEAAQCIDFNESCTLTDTSISCSGTWGSFSQTCTDETMTECDYSENIPTHVDPCNPLPEPYEDAENIYTFSCEQAAECVDDSTSTLALGESTIGIAAATDGGSGSGLAKACVDACKKGLRACILCWASLHAVAPPGANIPKPPNVTKPQEERRKIQGIVRRWIQKKGGVAQDGGPTPSPSPTMPRR